MDIAPAHRAPNSEVDQQRLELAAARFFDRDEKEDLTSAARASLGKEAQPLMAAAALEVGTQNGFAVDQPTADGADARDLRARRADAIDGAVEGVPEIVQVRLELAPEVLAHRGFRVTCRH
jgi:hypothetical protein